MHDLSVGYRYRMFPTAGMIVAAFLEILTFSHNISIVG